MIAPLLLLAALLSNPAPAGGGAPAQPPPATETQAQTPPPAHAAPAQPDRVCKVDAVDSRIKRKVCYDKKQMSDRTLDDRQRLEHIQADQH